jgi:hypothetical protein
MRWILGSEGHGVCRYGLLANKVLNTVATRVAVGGNFALTRKAETIQIC